MNINMYTIIAAALVVYGWKSEDVSSNKVALVMGSLALTTAVSANGGALDLGLGSLSLFGSKGQAQEGENGNQQSQGVGSLVPLAAIAVCVYGFYKEDEEFMRKAALIVSALACNTALAADPSALPLLGSTDTNSAGILPLAVLGLTVYTFVKEGEGDPEQAAFTSKVALILSGVAFSTAVTANKGQLALGLDGLNLLGGQQQSGSSGSGNGTQLTYR